MGNHESFKNLYKCLMVANENNLLGKVSQLFVVALGMDSYVNTLHVLKNEIPLFWSCFR